MSRPYTIEREPFGGGEWIPANPVIVTRDPNERDRVALTPEDRDRSLATKFDSTTNTLILSARDISKDTLNEEFKSAHQRGWRIERVLLFVSQDAWREEMPFFLRNGFEHQEG